MKEDITYTEAFNELKLIVKEIENGDIAIDELSQKIKKALSLLQICKTKLHSTNEDVQTILNEISIVGDNNQEID